MGAGHECRCLLVQAATVTHQHQGRVIGAGYGRPEHAGNFAHDEVAFDDTVRRCLRGETQRMHRLLPFGSAVLLRRSRRHLRQSPDRDDEGSTHVRTAFMGLTSSRGVTASGTLPTRTRPGTTIFLSTNRAGRNALIRGRLRET